MFRGFLLVLRFDKPRPVSKKELESRARALYGKKRLKWLLAWSKESWDRSEKRLFNVSAQMFGNAGKKERRCPGD